MRIVALSFVPLVTHWAFGYCARHSQTMSILIGIDLGTTVLKAAALDGRTGRVRAIAARRLAVRTEADGTREQNLRDLDRGLEAVMRELRSQLGRQWTQVAGLGLAAQGGSFTICNRDTGEPLTPMRLWSDQRPLRLVSKVAALRPVSYWQRLAFNAGPGLGLAKMLWLREQDPGLFADSNIYVGAGEYAMFRLTGQWRQDAGNALQIGCYHVPRRALDPEPLSLVDVPLSFVAPMREGHGALTLSAATASRWGLPAGLPVAGPYFDHEAGYLSTMGVLRRPLLCSLGTAWVGSLALANPPRSPNQLLVPAPHNDGWLTVQALMTGNVTWDWALATFVGGSHVSALRRAAEIFHERLLPPPGMIALPWMHLMNPFKRDATGAGGFFGGGVTATREDFVRVVALSMTYEMYRIFHQVRDQRKADGVVLAGGASKGACFRTFLAALFAPLPVYAMQEEDLTGMRGCLYGLSRQVAAGKARRVPVPARAVVERIREGSEIYGEIFNRMLGQEGITPLEFDS